MESVKQQIKLILQKSIKDLTGLEIVPALEHPADEKHGDYSTNVAMTIFVSSKFRTPMELAQKIVKILNTKYSILNAIEKVEAVAPGFINFWLSKEYLTTLMIRIIRAKDEYGKSARLENKKIMVEFTDPNPFKEFHIGHLYSNTVGESICRLLEANGAIVKRANYQGDVGMHVAKAIWGLLRLCHAEFISASDILQNKIPEMNSGQALKQSMKQVQDMVQDDKLDKRVKFLGNAYALGARAYEEDEKAKSEIQSLNTKIYRRDAGVQELWEKGRSWSLEYFETIYKRLGTQFDYYYFESSAGEIGINLVKAYLKKGVFKESNNAVIFPGEKFGLHNRVFINSQGFPTYEAKELGLAPTKHKDFKYDESIIVTGNEIIEYFKVLIAVLKQIYPDLAAKTKHVAHGIVRLRTGKMSSRTGKVLTGEWLLNEAKRRIITKYKEMDQGTAEKVAVGSVKYALLKSGMGKDISFNFDTSISLEGNSGPYLQYTFARAQSVVRKSEIRSGDRRTKSKTNSNDQNTKFKNYKLEPEEASLLRTVYRFPEVVEEAAEKFAPNLLCNFLFDLAQKFNLFYQRVPIIKGQISSLNPQVSIGNHPKGGQSQFRIGLTMAVGQIIKNGLYLLGISAPERI